MSWPLILVSAVLVNNFVMVKFLGICPFLGVSRSIGTALGMGVAVTFVMTLASAITWVIQYALLVTLDIVYLQTIAFILVIAVLVQLVEMILLKSSPALYRALGVYLPLITTNCAVLGVALVNVQEHYGFMETILNGAGSGLGFLLAIALFAGIRERLDEAAMPAWMRGFPSALIGAGLMSLAFLGFQGLIA